MGKVLTVTVPTYNAEEFLEKNLKSFLIEEILDDIEVLVINDGSTDRSLDIAMKYAKRYPESYHVITKENGGHGSGINCGIRNARGKYFKVVDADDWVEREAFIQLVNTLKSQDADVVYSGFLWAFEKRAVKAGRKRFELKAERKIPFKGVKCQKEYLFDEIADKLYVKMHNMTIKTDILQNHEIHIDEHCYYVDSEYVTYPLPWVETICFVSADVYMYRIRPGQSVDIKKMQQYEENYDRVITSLLGFYAKLEKEIPCSAAKKRYVASIVARIVAGKIKIMLSLPISWEQKEKLQIFDENLYKNYPEIYWMNCNKAVRILRMSRYWAYFPGAALMKTRC